MTITPTQLTIEVKVTTVGAHLAKYEVSSHIVHYINTSELLLGKREM